MQIAISILLKCTLVRKTSFHALKVRTIHHMERSFSAHQNEAWESFSTTKWSTWWHFSILHLDVVAWWWWWWRLRFWFYQRKREANSMEEALELLVKCLLSCHSQKFCLEKKFTTILSTMHSNYYLCMYSEEKVDSPMTWSSTSFNYI